MEKQEQPNQFIYPIPFQDFVNYRRKQNEAILSTYSIKQLSKLRKLKRLLQTTEQKICNRIKLFKKVSLDIQKKRQKQNYTHERLQSAKKQDSHSNQQLKKQLRSNCQHGYMKSTKSSLCGIRVKNTNQLERQQNNRKIQALIEEKHDHAKQIKMWKQRNKIIVQQRRVKQMRQKVKSANVIRSNRNKAKQIKIQCENEKFEEARRMKQQKFKQQIEKYDELQTNLSRLQREERQALIMWKKAMEQCQANR